MILRLAAGVATLGLVAVGPSGTLDAQRQGGTAAQTSPQVRPKAAPAGPLPPLPYEGYPASRPMQVVQAVYEFAARHPEVLSYMPCFCGCDRSAGHRANHDCFVKRRDATGRVVEWDSHGYGCAVCIDVARDSMQMYNSGASMASIRTAIDTKYGSRFPATMQTPKPPATATK